MAFTEYGALMLANVLRSKKATEVSINIIREFIRLKRKEKRTTKNLLPLITKDLKENSIETIILGGQPKFESY